MNTARVLELIYYCNGMSWCEPTTRKRKNEEKQKALIHHVVITLWPNTVTFNVKHSVKQNNFNVKKDSLYMTWWNHFTFIFSLLLYIFWKVFLFFLDSILLIFTTKDIAKQQNKPNSCIKLHNYLGPKTQQTKKNQKIKEK